MTCITCIVISYQLAFIPTYLLAVDIPSPMRKFLMKDFGIHVYHHERGIWQKSTWRKQVPIEIRLVAILSPIESFGKIVLESVLVIRNFDDNLTAPERHSE